MKEAGKVTAAILVIGDEILSGRTKEKNIGVLAERLAAAGIALREARIVADGETAIVEALDALRARYTYVFTTGGIGPTHDDITADCVAKAFGVPLPVDERALALMRPYYEKRGVALSGARLRMARLPPQAVPIANPISAAPGFMIGNVIVLPGIPATMAAMLPEALSRLETGPKTLSMSVVVASAEGDVADIFATHQEEFPVVAMGSYPMQKGDAWRTELVLRATDERTLKNAFNALIDKLTLSKFDVFY